MQRIMERSPVAAKKVEVEVIAAPRRRTGTQGHGARRGRAEDPRAEGADPGHRRS